MIKKNVNAFWSKELHCRSEVIEKRAQPLKNVTVIDRERTFSLFHNVMAKYMF
jgi:hypothetical protein